MEGFNSVIDKIISLLSEDGELREITFLNSYPPANKPVPLNKTYVTVGFRGVKMLSGSIGDYQGAKSGSGVYGRRAVITVGMKIYCPLKSGGNKCADIFSKICDSLMFRDRGFAIGKAQCGKVLFDASASAVVMESDIEINSVVGRNDESSAVNK